VVAHILTSLNPFGGLGTGLYGIIARPWLRRRRLLFAVLPSLSSLLRYGRTQRRTCSPRTRRPPENAHPADQHSDPALLFDMPARAERLLAFSSEEERFCASSRGIMSRTSDEIPFLLRHPAG